MNTRRRFIKAMALAIFSTQLFFENFDYLPNCSFMMYEEFSFRNSCLIVVLKLFYEPNLKVLHYCKGSTGLILVKKCGSFPAKDI